MWFFVLELDSRKGVKNSAAKKLHSGPLPSEKGKKGGGCTQATADHCVTVNHKRIWTLYFYTYYFRNNVILSLRLGEKSRSENLHGKSVTVNLKRKSVDNISSAIICQKPFHDNLNTEPEQTANIFYEKTTIQPIKILIHRPYSIETDKMINRRIIYDLWSTRKRIVPQDKNIYVSRFHGEPECCIS